MVEDTFMLVPYPVVVMGRARLELVGRLASDVRSWLRHQLKDSWVGGPKPDLRSIIYVWVVEWAWRHLHLNPCTTLRRNMQIPNGLQTPRIIGNMIYRIREHCDDILFRIWVVHVHNKLLILQMDQKL